jgi:hypothetical protein
MHDNADTRTTGVIRPHHNRIAQWLRQRRRTAISLLLRGACYGTGTGLASLAAWWIRTHM